MRTFDLDQFWPLPPVVQAAEARAPASLAADAGPLDLIDVPAASAAAADTGDTDAVTTYGQVRPLSSFADVEPFVVTRPGPVLFLRPIQRFFSAFDSQAAVWLSTGFVAGMVSWHAIGFWGFVSASVLSSPTAREPVQIAAHAAPQASSLPSQITTGSLPTFVPLPGACMALTVDRTSGATVAQTCNLGDQPMRDAGRRRKADRLPGAEVRLQAPSVWASATTATPAPNELTVEDRQAAPVEASDFDLRLRVDPQ